MSSRRFLLRRVWHLAIPTPPAMSSHRFHRFAQNFLLSVFSHGFHRSAQILRVRCSPTEFTEYTEFGSVVMAGMPYPPTSVRIRVICGRLFSARSFCAFRAFCGNLFPPTDFSLGGYGILPYPRHLLWDILPQNTPNSQNLLLRCPPTDFTDLHRYLGCAVLPQNLAAWVWQGCHTLLICEHPCHLWEALLCQKFLCVPCVLWESLSSHGFHRFTQILMVRCSPTEFTEYTEFVSVCIAGMPYPPTSVRIRAHLWEALLCQKFLCVPCVLWESLSSHGFHRFTQMLRVRFVPTEFTESTEFVSVGMAGMPYPPTSVNIRAVCGRLFSARGSVSSVLICGRLFSARSFCAFRAFCGNIFSPMEFTESTEFVSVGIAGMPYPPNL